MTRRTIDRRQDAKRYARIVSVLCGVIWTMGTAIAQLPLPGLTPSNADKAKPAGVAPAPESPQQAIARIRGQLDTLGPIAVPPEGAAAQEADAARQSRAALAFAYEEQIRAYNELITARGERQHAEEVEQAWKGFDEPPPYSIVMVDKLRDDAAALRERIRSLEIRATQVRANTLHHEADAKQAEVILRAAIEGHERAHDAGKRALAQWRVDVAQVESRRAGSWLALDNLHAELVKAILAKQHTGLRLLEHQLQVAGKNIRFTDDDVAKVRQRATQDVALAKAKLETLQGELVRRLRESELATNELSHLKAATGSDEAQVATAESRERATHAWVDAIQTEAAALRARITIATEYPQLWEQRLAAYTSPDADVRREALRRLREDAAELDRWRLYASTRVAESRAALRDAQSSLAEDDANGTVTTDRDAIVATQRALAARENTLATLDGLSTSLHRWTDESTAGSAGPDFQRRAADSWSAMRSLLRRLWNFEIFTVEDTVINGGQAVTVSRGVTVGKGIDAILLFLVGYAVAAFVSGRLERRLVAHGIDARRSRTVRRWSLAIITVLLLLFALNVVKIPLTVFAFLGGALAIGVGFGMQTIFKNFISGIILLVERNVQIGDIVEIEGVTGTVLSLDLRSSLLMGFDGVETVVPNSLLLENKVTNWTHSNKRVRRIVKVGVAYGSPVRDVARILEDCAHKHKSILDSPAPTVIFEEFGDSALVFALYFWVELVPDVSPLVVMSDLRFEIERDLREAGIVIAFPQRDINFNNASPLRVELVSSRAEP